MDASQAWDCIAPACPAPSSVPQDAWDRFPGPFSTTGQTSASSLTVLDCLEGLQAARDRKWLQDYHVFDTEGWRFLREKFDASWLIPGEVLALANPTGTAGNPRFPGLLEPSSPGSPPLSPSMHTCASGVSLSSAVSQRPGPGGDWHPTSSSRLGNLRCLPSLPPAHGAAKRRVLWAMTHLQRFSNAIMLNVLLDSIMILNVLSRSNMKRPSSKAASK
eukprot:TRINITY_DN16282_c0_g1_i1.p1 TRINITY_DN16282_c0_g1~~TRINITY_DN16282_c0_g1_i1.p1  ORF type:complete len:235 (-),score=34.60 TRINITY_DN16282_c0_g1_i1:647-1300(-)